MKMEDHLTVKKLREAGGLELTLDERKSLTALDLRGLARACGAHDGGIVETSRTMLEPRQAEILHHYPWTRSLVSIGVMMSRERVRGAPRSVTNLEFHQSMMDAMKATLLQLGAPEGQLKTAAFGSNQRDPAQQIDKAGKVVAQVKLGLRFNGRCS